MAYVVALSLVLQLMAAALAMWLARRTERRVAWSLITAALVLMVFRRALPLYHVLASDPSVVLDPYQESIGLALSFLMVAGIAAIAPLFTAVRRAEEKLKESERRASLVLEATSDGIYDVDLRTGATRYSPRYAEMLGYGPTELVLSPESGTFESLLHPDDRESTLRTLGRCLAGKTDGYNAEFRLRTKAGDWLWIESRGCVVERDPAGNPLGLVGTHTDITERKKAEDARTLNSQRVEALLQLNGMAAATLQEITDFALEEAVRLTQSKIGYLAFLNEDESVLTMHSWSKSAMAECAMAEKPIVYPVLSTGLWGEAVRQRRPVVTNDYAAADPRKKGYPQGHVALTRHMNTPVFDGSRIVIVAGVGNKAEEYDQGDIQQLTLLMEGMWRLIERKRAEEALRVEKANLAAIFESSPVSMMVLDETTNIVLANAALVVMTGGSRADVLQHRPGNALRCVHSVKDPRGCGYSKECSLCAARRGIEGLIASGGTMRGAELVLELIRDGEPQKVWLRMGAEHILLDGCRHLCVALEDITERKRAEEKIRSINVELDERVSERTAQLESTNQQLSAENAARQQAEHALLARNEDLKGFAYTVSHDLKAPLRGISGYSAELDRKHRAGLDERAQFCIAQILTATRNLDRLIEDLLHYSRLDAETPSLTRVNLRSLVEAILQDHSPIIAEQRAEVAVDVPPITLETWERGLVQVLTNLIDNALKYSRKALPPRLTIAAEELSGTCRLTVADNGIGFDMKYHDRIFGLFNRLVRADEFEGTGAGLAIVKKLTEKLGGTIHAESALGQGATFFVELPNEPTRRTVP